MKRRCGDAGKQGLGGKRAYIMAYGAANYRVPTDPERNGKALAAAALVFSQFVPAALVATADWQPVSPVQVDGASPRC